MCLLDLDSDPESWASGLDHLRQLLTAIVQGRYRQERLVRFGGTPVRTRGIFELPSGVRVHHVKHSRSWLRRTKQELISFDPY
jgi:hypothetical protein